MMYYHYYLVDTQYVPCATAGRYPGGDGREFGAAALVTLAEVREYALANRNLAGFGGASRARIAAQRR